MTLKRRQFFKLGLGGLMLTIVKPARGAEILGKVDAKVRKPVVISTWNHGLAANNGAWEILVNKGKALDAVEKGVMVTEADLTNRSVGLGGMPDKEGKVTLDACIMDENSNCGSVAFVQNYMHPISIARDVMEKTPHIMLVGEGAEEFANSRGYKKHKAPIPEVKERWKKWKKEQSQLAKKPEINHENHDTIGMLAIDEFGNLSGACTTSGWAYKMHGRVGDSPIIGAGLFVDNEVGAACATGLGEAVIRIAGSHTVVEYMRNGYSPQEACKLTVERLISKHADIQGVQVGFLAIDKNGNHGAYSVFSGFNYALRTNDINELIDAPYDRK